MYVRRSKFEQEMEILKAAEIPNLLTRMMYATGLSWKPLKIMISSLIKRDLLQPLTWDEYYARPDTPHKEKGWKPVNKPLNPRIKIWYVITEKGKTILEYQNKIMNLTNDSDILKN